ncbi:MAG: hypothetical protein GY803_27890 [Chloroflexi bacterium]|nr:hypothetical protein [Chloroflexota bacterium]
MTQTIQNQISKIDAAIQAQEGLRGINPDTEIDAVVHPLQAKKAALQAQLPSGGSGNINLGGGSVGGSINTGTIIASGDYVGGDKIDGDKVGGDKITVGDIADSNVAIGKKASNRIQNAAALQDDGKAELIQLVTQLEAALKQLPAAQQAEAETVAQEAGNLVNEATRPDAAPAMVEITGDRLQKAADNLKAIMPTVAVIAGQIITAIARYT